MTPTQRRYPTVEQEMPAIVKLLKENRNFLLGATIEIFIDHKKFLSSSSTNNHAFRWNQKIEEFANTIQYVKGHTNVEADQQADPALLEAEREDSRFSYALVYGTKLITYQILR